MGKSFGGSIVRQAKKSSPDAVFVEFYADEMLFSRLRQGHFKTLGRRGDAITEPAVGNIAVKLEADFAGRAYEPEMAQSGHHFVLKLFTKAALGAIVRNLRFGSRFLKIRL
nr:hypothetical protein [Bradyrhizobium sp. WSM2254]